MMQSGLFNSWHKKYWPGPNRCSLSGGQQTTEARPLAIKNFLGCFFIIGFGTVLGLVVVIIEITLRRIYI